MDKGGNNKRRSRLASLCFFAKKKQDHRPCFDVVPKAGDSPVRGNVAISYSMGKATKGLPSPAKGLNPGSSTPLFRGVK